MARQDGNGKLIGCGKTPHQGMIKDGVCEGLCIGESQVAQLAMLVQSKGGGDLSGSHGGPSAKN